MAADEPDDLDLSSDLSAGPQHDSLLKKVALSVAPPSSPSPVALAPGRQLGDRYIILRAIGSGGMGEVYLARDLTLERDVAIKRHRQGREVERLRREAIAMARLAHPNVVTVFEVGELDGGAYVAMEYVPGGTLRGYFAEERRPAREVLAMLRQIGEGLAAAHAAGIVHRDFKPENVLIGKDGRPRVSDFGLARDARAAASVADAGGDLARTLPMPGEAEAGDEANDRAKRAKDIAFGTAATMPRLAERLARAAATAETIPAVGAALGQGSTVPPLPAALQEAITQAGAVMGTPAYMAPEQAAGEAVDARADQFAFCVVAWEALFGARPAAGAPRRGTSSRTGDGERLQLGRGRRLRRVRAALSRGLSVDPAERYPSMRELLDELDERLPWRALAAAALALIAAAVLVWQLSREQPLQCDDAGAEIAALQIPVLAGEASAIVGKQIADLRKDFRAAAASSCRARKSGGWTDELYRRARACLAVSHEVTRSQLAMLSSRDAAMSLERALPLPSPAFCADAEQLSRWPALPPDDVAASTSARAALELAERALARRDRPVAAALIAAAARSPEAKAPFLAARLAQLSAQLLLASGDANDLDRGQAQLAAARLLAASSGDVETQLRSAAAQLTAAGTLRLDRAAAEALLPDANAEADALARLSPDDAARIYLAAAAIVTEEPRPLAPLEDPEPLAPGATVGFSGLTHEQASTRGADRAAAFLTKAFALLGDERPNARATGRASPLRITAFELRAGAHLIMGRFAEGRADLMSAVELARLLYGRDSAEVARVSAHCAQRLSEIPVATETAPCAADAARILALPELPPSPPAARALRTLGEYEHLEGKLPAARAHLEAARQMLLALAVKDVELAAVDQSLSLVHFDERRPDLALPLLDEALAIQAGALPANHVEIASSHYNLAVAYRDRGDLAAARLEARRAADAFILLGDGDHARYSLALFAEVANRAGDPRAALEATEHLRRWTRASDANSLAWPRLERVRAMIALKDKSDEPLRLLREAHGLYDMLQNDQRLAEIDRLLVELSAMNGKPVPKL